MPPIPIEQQPPYPIRDEPGPLLYRISDAVAVTGLSRSKIYELIAEGELQIAHFGRAVRIVADSLRALIARRAEPRR